MADPKEMRRLAALQHWASHATGARFPVPEAAELAAISANPNNWAALGASPLARAWAQTIDFILHQVKFGVEPASVVAFLPTELQRPTGDVPRPAPPPNVAPAAADPPPQAAPLPPSPPAAPPPAAPRTESTPPVPDDAAAQHLHRYPDVVAALVRWRTEQISAGVPGADAIKDVTLRNLVKFNHTDAEVIRRKLPPTAADLAEDIAEVIARFADPTRAAPQRPPEPTPGRHRVAPDSPTGPLAAQPAAPAARKIVPSVGAPGAAGAGGVVLDLAHGDFCEYEYGESEVTVGAIEIRATAEGLRLAFEQFAAPPGTVVLYRVVSGDDTVPYKPEAGELLTVTTAAGTEDNRFLTSAVRNYQVWCHVGVDEHDARRSQPFLWARGEEVSQVEDFSIHEDQGRVIGQWSVYPGTRAVRVYRIPLDGPTPANHDPRHQICADQPNLTGFVDSGATRGARFLYKAMAEVNVNDLVRLSRPRQQDILVTVTLQGVADLAVTVTDDESSEFDLRWTTPPAGQVRIYRLGTPPPAGLTDSEFQEAALGPQGFTEQTRINYPVTAGATPTVSQIAGVPWPAAWQRAYLTPVTVLNGQARIGRTRVQTRPLPPVFGAKIVERFHTEIATFGWPDGAANVLAFVGSRTTAPQEICSGDPVAEISKSHHRRDGGLTFRTRLDTNGCTVCLVPVAYSGGEQITGAITALDYPGLTRIRYAFTQQHTPPPRFVIDIWLRGDTDIEAPPPFVLVNNPHRFPLEPQDGRPVYLTPPGGGQAVPQCYVDRISVDGGPTGWTAELTEEHGYVRLFALTAGTPVTSRPYALLDPELQWLRIPPPPGPPQ